MTTSVSVAPQVLKNEVIHSLDELRKQSGKVFTWGLIQKCTWEKYELLTSTVPIARAGRGPCLITTQNEDEVMVEFIGTPRRLSSPS